MRLLNSFNYEVKGVSTHIYANGNLSVITSAQNQAQRNDALSIGTGINAQTNVAAQGAANLNAQIGFSNTGVIDNTQNSGQANTAVSLPTLKHI